MLPVAASILAPTDHLRAQGSESTA